MQISDVLKILVKTVTEPIHKLNVKSSNPGSDDFDTFGEKHNWFFYADIIFWNII